MGVKVTVAEIENIENSSGIPALNENQETLADEFDLVHYRDGSLAASGNWDMNSNRILNLPDGLTSGEPLTVRQLEAITAILTAPDSIAAEVIARIAADTAIRDDLLASTGGSIVAYIATGAGAISRSVTSKLRDTVSLLDFVAVSNNPAVDNTADIAEALATGKHIYAPTGHTFYIHNLTGFVDHQRIFGGATFKKYGVVPGPMCILPDEGDGIWFDNLEFDGNKSAFVTGDEGAAIFGYIQKSTKLTNCRFHDTIDSSVKLRDSAKLYARGCTFSDSHENGIELRHYTTDLRTGLPYVGNRPLKQGGHRIIDNTFERITRFENPAGPIVDSCAITMDGAAGYKIKGAIVKGNNFIDCLRCVFSENYGAASEAEGIIIEGNTFEGSVNGDTGDNIYCKVSVGLVSVHDSQVKNNVFMNPVNHNPVGTETAAIYISKADVFTDSDNITVSGNTILDDGLLPDPLEYGVYCLSGTRIRCFNNSSEGHQNSGFYFHPAFTSDITVHSNEGGDEDHSWGNVVPFTFRRTDIPVAASTYDLWADGEVGVDVHIFPCEGRVVGMTARSSASPGTNYTITPFISPGTSQAGVEITQADFGGGFSGIKRQTSLAGDTVGASNQLWVKFTNDGAAAGTIDLVVTVWVDLNIKH